MAQIATEAVRGGPDGDGTDAYPQSNRKRWAALVLGIALGVVLPVLAFQGVDVSESWHRAMSCRGSDLMLAGFCFLATLWLRAWRWQVLLEGRRRVRAGSCLSATCVGFLANNVLPFRLGELVRVRSLRQLEGVSAAALLGSVAIERVLDLLALVLMLAGYLVLVSAGPHAAELALAGWVALAITLALASVLALGYWRRHWLRACVAGPLSLVSARLADRAADIALRFCEGLKVFASVRQVVQVGILSLGVWGVSVGTCWFVGRGLGLDLAPEHYVVVVFMTAFGAVVPAAPGAVGTYHGFARLGLYLVAVHSGEVALAFAAVLHALEWVLVNATGLWFLARDRLRLLAPKVQTTALPAPA